MHFLNAKGRSVVHTDHDGSRLDDGVGFLADHKAEPLDRAHADGRRDDVSARDLDADDGIDRTFLDGYNLALELISCTELHFSLLLHK